MGMRLLSEEREGLVPPLWDYRAENVPGAKREPQKKDKQNQNKNQVLNQTVENHYTCNHVFLLIADLCLSHPRISAT